MSALERLSQKYDKSILDKKEVAKELCISVSAVNHRLSELKDIPNFFRDGRFVRFRIEDVAHYLDSKTTIKTIY